MSSPAAEAEASIGPPAVGHRHPAAARAGWAAIALFALLVAAAWPTPAHAAPAPTTVPPNGPATAPVPTTPTASTAPPASPAPAAPATAPPGPSTSAPPRTPASGRTQTAGAPARRLPVRAGSAGGRDQAPAPTTTAPPPAPQGIQPLPLRTVAPSTLPLDTRPASAHVSALFPALSVAGFGLLLVLVLLQVVLTRPGRRGWTL